VASPKKKGLGKGLGALFKDGGARQHMALEGPKIAAAGASAEEAPHELATLADGSRLVLLDPTEVKPNPKQPRRVFDEDALQELSASIKRDGVQEPVIVRERNGGYELVSGERRVRASVMADLRAIPAVVRDISDDDLLTLGLIENIQREDLNAIELALGYQQLLDERGLTQEEVALAVGKKRATVANTLRLLNLPEAVQDQVGQGILSMGHARALLAIEDPVAQQQAARKIIAEGLSVRQAEKIAAHWKNPPPPPKAPAQKDPNIAQLEETLRRSLGTKVSLKPQDGGKGRIEIEYYNMDDLDRILDKLKH